MVHMLPQQDVPHQRSKTQITSHIWRSINTQGTQNHWIIERSDCCCKWSSYSVEFCESLRTGGTGLLLLPFPLTPIPEHLCKNCQCQSKPTHISLKSLVKTAFIILFQPQKQTIEQNHEVSVLIPFFSFFHFFFLKMQKLPHKARVACWELNS